MNNYRKNSDISSTHERNSFVGDKGKNSFNGHGGSGFISRIFRRRSKSRTSFTSLHEASTCDFSHDTEKDSNYKLLGQESISSNSRKLSNNSSDDGIAAVTEKKNSFKSISDKFKKENSKGHDAPIPSASVKYSKSSSSSASPSPSQESAPFHAFSSFSKSSKSTKAPFSDKIGQRNDAATNNRTNNNHSLKNPFETKGLLDNGGDEDINNYENDTFLHPSSFQSKTDATKTTNPFFPYVAHSVSGILLQNSNDRPHEESHQTSAVMATAENRISLGERDLYSRHQGRQRRLDEREPNYKPRARPRSTTPIRGTCLQDYYMSSLFQSPTPTGADNSYTSPDTFSSKDGPKISIKLPPSLDGGKRRRSLSQQLTTETEDKKEILKSEPSRQIKWTPRTGNGNSRNTIISSDANSEDRKSKISHDSPNTSWDKFTSKEFEYKSNSKNNEPFRMDNCMKGAANKTVKEGDHFFSSELSKLAPNNLGHKRVNLADSAAKFAAAMRDMSSDIEEFNPKPSPATNQFISPPKTNDEERHKNLANYNTESSDSLTNLYRHNIRETEKLQEEAFLNRRHSHSKNGGIKVTYDQPDIIKEINQKRYNDSLSNRECKKDMEFFDNPNGDEVGRPRYSVTSLSSYKLPPPDIAPPPLHSTYYSNDISSNQSHASQGKQHFGEENRISEGDCSTFDRKSCYANSDSLDQTTFESNQKKGPPPRPPAPIETTHAKVGSEFRRVSTGKKRQAPPVPGPTFQSLFQSPTTFSKPKEPNPDTIITSNRTTATTTTRKTGSGNTWDEFERLTAKVSKTIEDSRRNIEGKGEEEWIGILKLPPKRDSVQDIPGDVKLKELELQRKLGDSSNFYPGAPIDIVNMDPKAYKKMMKKIKKERERVVGSSKSADTTALKLKASAQKYSETARAARSKYEAELERRKQMVPAAKLPGKMNVSPVTIKKREEVIKKISTPDQKMIRDINSGSYDDLQRQEYSSATRLPKESSSDLLIEVSNVKDYDNDNNTEKSILKTSFSPDYSLIGGMEDDTKDSLSSLAEKSRVLSLLEDFVQDESNTTNDSIEANVARTLPSTLISPPSSRNTSVPSADYSLVYHKSPKHKPANPFLNQLSPEATTSTISTNKPVDFGDIGNIIVPFETSQIKEHEHEVINTESFVPKKLNPFLETPSPSRDAICMANLPTNTVLRNNEMMSRDLTNFNEDHDDTLQQESLDRRETKEFEMGTDTERTDSTTNYPLSLLSSTPLTPIPIIPGHLVEPEFKENSSSDFKFKDFDYSHEFQAKVPDLAALDKGNQNGIYGEIEKLSIIGGGGDTFSNSAVLDDYLNRKLKIDRNKDGGGDLLNFEEEDYPPIVENRREDSEIFYTGSIPEASPSDRKERRQQSLEDTNGSNKMLKGSDTAATTTPKLWKLYLKSSKPVPNEPLWYPICVKLLNLGKKIRLYRTERDKHAFQEISMQPTYECTPVYLQPYDSYGKILVVKLQHVIYKERFLKSGISMVSAAITAAKFSREATTLLKFGCFNSDYFEEFVCKLEDVLFKLEVYRELSASHTHQATGGGPGTSTGHVREEVTLWIREDYTARVISQRDEAVTQMADLRRRYSYYGSSARGDVLSRQNSIVVGNTLSLTDQKIRVRVFCLTFLRGMPICELGINDIRRIGTEIVGRKEIIPCVSDEWIRINTKSIKFHSCVFKDEYGPEHKYVIRFLPLDAVRFELFRLTVPTKENFDLPIKIKLKVYGMYTTRRGRQEGAASYKELTGFKIICDLISSFTICHAKIQTTSFPCENVAIHVPIPVDWIYLFREEKTLKFGSKHSQTRVPGGKIKGFSRFLMFGNSSSTTGMEDVPSTPNTYTLNRQSMKRTNISSSTSNISTALEADGTILDDGFVDRLANDPNALPLILETTYGQAKYEHVYRSLVWRIPKLSLHKGNAFKEQRMICVIRLGAHDVVPEDLRDIMSFATVEYDIGTTYASNLMIRSLSVNRENEQHNPTGTIDKEAIYVSHFKLRVKIVHTNEHEEGEEGDRLQERRRQSRQEKDRRTISASKAKTSSFDKRHYETDHESREKEKIDLDDAISRFKCYSTTGSMDLLNLLPDTTNENQLLMFPPPTRQSSDQPAKSNLLPFLDTEQIFDKISKLNEEDITGDNKIKIEKTPQDEEDPFGVL